MILGAAELTIASGQGAKFEDAGREAVPLFLPSRGCRGVRHQWVLETHGLYRLLVNRETLENPVVHFWGSEVDTRWRSLVTPHFAAPAAVMHLVEVLSSLTGWITASPRRFAFP